MSAGSGIMRQAIADTVPDVDRSQLELVCSTVASLFGANQVSLWAYGAPAAGTSGGVVSFVAGCRWDGPGLPIGTDGRWYSVPLVELPTFCSAVQTSSPSVFEDSRRATGRQKELMATLGAFSFECEPVTFNGRAVGVLMIDPPQVLDTERSVLLPTIMEEAAFLLSKVEMHHYREEAGFLLTLIGNCTTTRSVEHVLSTTCDALARRLSGRHATVFLAGPDGRLAPAMSKRADGVQDVQSWHDFDLIDDEIAPYLEAWRSSEVPLESRATGWWEHPFGAASLLGTSIRVGNSSFGVLVVDTEVEREFTRAESYLLHEVAALLGWLVRWAGTDGPSGGQGDTAQPVSSRWLLGISDVEDRTTDDVVSAVCAQAARLFGTDVAYPVSGGQATETGYASLPPVRHSFATGEVASDDDLIATLGGSETPVLRSAITVPLGTGKRPWYVVACGNFSQVRRWSPQDVTNALRLSLEGSLRLEIARLARVDRHQVTSLARKLLRDPVTNLPNTLLLVDRIEQAIHRARRDRVPLSIVCLDIAQLGEVGESLGDDRVDVLLAQAADRLARTLRAADVVARVGDSEFAVLLTTGSASGVSIVSDKIRRVMSLPFDLGGEMVLVSSRIGVAQWPEQGDDPSALLGAAVDALRRDGSAHAMGPPPGPPAATRPATGSSSAGAVSRPPWEAGSGTGHTGSPAAGRPAGSTEDGTGRVPLGRAAALAATGRADGTEAVAATQAVATSAAAANSPSIPPHVAAAELGRAIEDNQLVLHYLPKVSLSDGDVTSMEALVRWAHPTYGLLRPATFLPQVQDTDLGWQVTRWVLNKALDQCASWLTQGLSLAVSINISRHDVIASPIIDEVHDALARTHLLGRHLTLEISEQAVIDEMVRGSAVFVILRSEGVRISVDDCGSGKVAPLYLARMPVDEIKIDSRLLEEDDPEDTALLRSIVQIGHSFGIQITAEAIEERTSAGGMEKMGIDNIQGFHIAGPLLPENVPVWVQNHRERTNNERNVVWTG